MFKRIPRTISPTASSVLQESTADSAAPAHEIIRLQSLIGNHATMRLLKLQRDPVIELEGILDPQQVASAIAFYKMQPARYTKQVINQIQQTVGTPEKDAIDAADVQAVAQWQKDHGSEFKPELKLDGKAGPRTLPRMFGSGLAPSNNISQYVGEMKAIFDQWDTLKTPEARRLALQAEINKHLTSIGVPVVELVKSDGNHFDNIRWVIEIRPTAFEDMPTDPEERERRPTAITATLYHEARHGEQDFRIAAMLAGRKDMTEDKIFAQTNSGTKRAVIQEAMKKENQLKPGTMEAAIAEGWFDSIYGADSAKRNRIFAEKDVALAEANAAADAFKAKPTPENKRRLEAAVKRADRAVDAYKDLPEENDSFRIGDEVIAKFQALLKTK